MPDIMKGEHFQTLNDQSVTVNPLKGAPRAFTKMFKDIEYLDYRIRLNVTNLKYTHLTPIQKYAIPAILSGRDVMGCAPTGSGKTAAFLLPVITMILSDPDEMREAEKSEVPSPIALVIAPTRELVSQIYEDARLFSKHTGLRPAIIHGGLEQPAQSMQFEDACGCHLLVATTGKLLGYLKSGEVSLANVKYLILDEADRMVKLETAKKKRSQFLKDMRRVIDEFGMPDEDERQTIMFSAALFKEVQQLARDEFLNDSYFFIRVGELGGTHSFIEQKVIDVPVQEKRERLWGILSKEREMANKSGRTYKAIVFEITIDSTEQMQKEFEERSDEFSSVLIHRNISQSNRSSALKQFREGKVNILVATPVAARGLDIPQVDLVINYCLPDPRFFGIAEYIHQIGRTGRMGNKGRAISFFSRGQDEGIARLLVKTLSDSEQEVPDWLDDIARYQTGSIAETGGTGDIRGRIH